MRLWTTALIVALVAAPPSLGQIDPKENIKKILETIDEELEEIDRLLLQAKPDQSSAGSTAEMRKRVQETQGSQDRVVRGIDELIEQLRQMQGGQGSGGSSQDQQQAQRGEQDVEDQQQSRRQENQTQQPPPDGTEPQGRSAQENHERPRPGENTDVGQLPDGGEERSLREADRARWGNLPQYDLGRHSRGGLPEVPEKYRRLLEAYQKANQKARRDSR